MSAENQQATFGQVLRNRRFLALWLAQLVSNFGDWLALLALFSLVTYGYRGTPYQVAGVLISFIIPAAMLGPVAGVFVDRWNLKRTMIASDLLRAVIAAALAFPSQLYQLYPLIFALSAVSCFFMPAQMSTLPLIVGKEELLLANSINTQSIQFNRIIAPAVAGLLVEWAGEKLCFFIDSFSFLFSAAMIFLIAFGREPVQSEKGVSAIRKEFVEGVKFIISHRALLFVIVSMTAAILALGAFDALIAVYVRDVLSSGRQVFGAILSLVGAGTIIGSLIIGRFNQQHPKVYLVVMGIFLLGAGVLVLSLFGKVWVTLASTSIFGLGVAYVLVPAQTLMQEGTPQNLLGRVSGAWMSMMTLAQLTSFLAAGVIADQIGIRNLYISVAMMLMMIAVIGFMYARTSVVQEARAEASD
jgi:MFS family permease